MRSKPWVSALVGFIGLASLACSSSVGSIGAVLGRDNDTGALYVRDVPKGMGADRAGLLPGDEIVMIDGVFVRDLGPDAIHNRLRGDIGSKVELTIVRSGEVRHVSVMRGELRTKTLIKPKEEVLEP